MRKTQGSLALAGYNDIFNAGTDGAAVREIPIAELFPPDFHPFHVNDDAAMERLAENIKEYGVREPGLARPRADGGYELLAGNRRKRACELAGIATMPVIVRELTDDEAAIIMVECNPQHNKSSKYGTLSGYPIEFDAYLTQHEQERGKTPRRKMHIHGTAKQKSRGVFSPDSHLPLTAFTAPRRACRRTHRP